MVIDEKIHIRPHDPAWIVQFEQEKQRLSKGLGAVVLGIEHIGSTAVPGIWAKPVVDIMVGVPGLPLEDRYIVVMNKMGYEYLGEAGVPGRLYFRKRRPRAFNVHFTPMGSGIWMDNILLRDYLRSHQDAAESYSDIKRNILSEGIDTLLAYSDRKSDFIRALIGKAREGI